MMAFAFERVTKHLMAICFLAFSFMVQFADGQTKPPTKSTFERKPEAEIYPDKAFTGREYADLVRNHLIKHIDFLDETRVTDTALRDETKAYLREVVEKTYLGSTLEVREALWKKGQELKSKSEVGSDPLFLTYLSHLANCSSHCDESVSLGLSAVKKYPETKYPTFLVVFTHRTITSSQKTMDGVAGSIVELDQYREAMSHWIKNDLRETGQELRIVWSEYLSLFEFSVSVDRQKSLAFAESLVFDKKIPEWLQSIILGHKTNNLAWQKRGGGYANTVTPQGFEEFETLGRESADHFKKALDICPYFPEPAAWMINIARDGNTDESFQHWFDEVKSIQFDYYPAYEHFAFASFPRWHGSSEKLIEFGEECLASNRFDTFVPFFYLTCLDHARKESNESNKELQKAFDSKETNEKLLQAIEGTLANSEPVYRNNAVIDKKYLTSLKYMTLLRLERFQEALALLDQMDYPISPQARSYFQTNVSDQMMRSRGHALAGEYGQAYLEMAKLRGKSAASSDNFDEILEIAKPILNDLDEGLARKCFDQVVRSIESRRAFEDGKLIDISFDPAFLMWRSTCFENLTVESDKSVVYSNPDGSGTRLDMTASYFEGPKTIEITCECLDKEPLLNSIFTMQFMTLEKKNDAFAKDNFWELSYLPKLNFIGLGTESSGPFYRYRLESPDENKTKHRFRFNIDVGYFELFVDDLFVLRMSGERIQPHVAIYLTQNAWSSDRGTFRISDISIQRWNNGRPPFEEEPQKLVDHYSNRVKKNEKDLWSLHYRGLARILADDLDGALEDLKAANTAGIPLGVSAFYIGHAYDLKGEKKTAREWYLKCMNSDYGARTHLLVYQGSKMSEFNASLASAACLRYQWVGMTSGTKDDFANYEFKNLMHSGPEWVSGIHTAQHMAVNGKHKQACRLLSGFLNVSETIPEDVLDVMKKQLAAFEKGEMYTEPENALPFYLSKAIDQRLFAHFEDCMTVDTKRLMKK